MPTDMPPERRRVKTRFCNRGVNEKPLRHVGTGGAFVHPLADYVAIASGEGVSATFFERGFVGGPCLQAGEEVEQVRVISKEATHFARFEDE